MSRLTPIFLLFLSSLLPLGAGEPLRLVAYNIKHGQGMDGKIDLERIAKVIAREKPDIVALQEVDQTCKRSGSVDQAAVLGKLLKMEHRFGKFMDFQGGEYGMAVLSRFPIEATNVHKLPLGAEPRCALEIVVKSPNWPGKLSFVGIHNDWTKEEIRVKQISALMKLLEKETYPMILAGDFNAQPKSESLNLIKKEGWEMLRKKRTNTWPSVDPKVEIDFFFAKEFSPYSYEDRVIDERVASDHRPIAVVISPKEEKKD